jgi:hypothetical protein
VFDIAVPSGADDIEERQSDGVISATSSDLDLMLDGSTAQSVVGLRFLNVPVPQGATVTNAYVQFRADETSSETTNLSVAALAEDNAAAFGSGRFSLSSRPRTSAVSWPSVPSWSSGAVTAAQRTPNLAAAIQQVVNRAQWSAGNALALVITGSGRRVAEAFEGNAPPILHLEVSNDAKPGVAITSPAPGSVVAGTVTVQATASDDKGVASVQFFDGLTSLGTDTDGGDGWSVSWNSAAGSDGPHTVTAVATDTAGQTGSGSVAVTVDNVDGPPAVTVTAPADGALVSSASVTVQASASDDRGVASVEFLAGATSLGVDTNGADGWSATWSTGSEADGPHVVTAVATDTIGQQASDSNTVTLDKTAPAVVVSGPADGAVVSGVTGVTASATDANGVASVAFFADATQIGVDTNGADGWSVAWDTRTLVNGSRSLTARATDNAGLQTTSPPVGVTVDNPLVFEIAVSSGANDIEERLSDGRISATSTDLDLMLDNATQQSAVGLRFLNVPIPQGATVTNAYVQFRADETTSTTADLSVAALAEDNAAAFTSGRFSLSSRPRTSAVSWLSVPGWSAGAVTAAQRTPNLASAIQQVVDRSLWSSGNALALVITGSGRRVAEAFEGGAPPLLHVEYEL